MYSDSDITVDPGVDGPYSVTVTLNNPSQYTGVETVEKRVGVRFACLPSDDSIDFYSIINPFDLGNIEPVNGQFSGAMRVTSTNAEFKKGTLSNEQNQALIDLTGSIFVQEEAPYADFEVFIDTSEIDVPLDAVPFNPCHPEYGIFNLSFGVVTLDTVLDWFSSPLYPLWVQDTLGLRRQQLNKTALWLRGLLQSFNPCLAMSSLVRTSTTLTTHQQTQTYDDRILFEIKHVDLGVQLRANMLRQHGQQNDLVQGCE